MQGHELLVHLVILFPQMMCHIHDSRQRRLDASHFLFHVRQVFLERNRILFFGDFVACNDTQRNELRWWVARDLVDFQTTTGLYAKLMGAILFNGKVHGTSGSVKVLSFGSRTKMRVDSTQQSSRKGTIWHVHEINGRCVVVFRLLIGGQLFVCGVRDSNSQLREV